MMQESDARALVAQMQSYQQNGTLTRIIPLCSGLGCFLIVQFAASGHVYHLRQPRAWGHVLQREEQEAARLARMQPLARFRLQKMIRDTWEPLLATLEQRQHIAEQTPCRRCGEADPWKLDVDAITLHVLCDACRKEREQVSEQQKGSQ